MAVNGVLFLPVKRALRQSLRSLRVAAPPMKRL
jgi:hypothetical protein